MIEQQSAEWFAQRLGKVTASRIKDIMATTKSGYSTSRKNYMMQLLCERLTGKKEESYTNTAMQRGTNLEAMARGVYEGLNGLLVEETGFVPHPSIEMAGASPDGFVGDDGLIEIKCPNTAQHVEFLQTGKIDKGYILQMQFQMMCTERKWCDFVSYDDRLPEVLQYRCKRVEFDDDCSNEITAEVKTFLSELSELESQMRKMMEQA